MSKLLIASGSALLISAGSALLISNDSSIDPDPKTLTYEDFGHTATVRERTFTATAQENR